MDPFTQKLFLGLPLIYALYIVAICPCDPVPSCHYLNFIGATSLSLGTAFYLNYNIK